LFSTDRQAGFAIFFRKSFAYGATVWLMVSAGASLAASAAGVAALLAGLDTVQLWLPNLLRNRPTPYMR
jgi:hypothetical protein